MGYAGSMSSDAPHPSLLNRVARRLSRVRKVAADGLEAIRVEASHPGRPQPHRVGRNPAWQTEEDRQADRATPSVEYRPGGDTGVDPYARPTQDGAAGDDAWYLKGEHEGWDQTNPTSKDED